jgi:hypothetical protein
MTRTYLNPSTARKMMDIQSLTVEPEWVKVAEDILIENGGEVFDPEAGKPSDEPFQVEGDGYEELTVTELKEMLKEEGLSTAGNKADLVARLRTPIPIPEEVPAEALTLGGETGLSEGTPVEKTPEGDVSESKESSSEKPAVEREE